jgi:hypothetical protein
LSLYFDEGVPNELIVFRRLSYYGGCLSDGSLFTQKRSSSKICCLIIYRSLCLYGEFFNQTISRTPIERSTGMLVLYLILPLSFTFSYQHIKVEKEEEKNLAKYLVWSETGRTINQQMEIICVLSLNQPLPVTISSQHINSALSCNETYSGPNSFGLIRDVRFCYFLIFPSEKVKNFEKKEFLVAKHALHPVISLTH